MLVTCFVKFGFQSTIWKWGGEGLEVSSAFQIVFQNSHPFETKFPKARHQLRSICNKRTKYIFFRLMTLCFISGKCLWFGLKAQNYISFKAGDSGLYECQVSTTPILSHYVYLKVAGTRRLFCLLQSVFCDIDSLEHEYGIWILLCL